MQKRVIILFSLFFFIISSIAWAEFNVVSYSAGENSSPPVCGVPGYVLPGQIVYLKVKLHNNYAAVVSSISGTITLLNDEVLPSGSLITMIDNIDSWADMIGDDSQCNENGFIFQVNKDIDCHYRLQFSLNISSSLGSELLFFSVPIGEMNSEPTLDVPDYRITSDPEMSENPVVAWGPDEYGIVWKDYLDSAGLYFKAYDRFFNQKVGPKLIPTDGSDPCLLYNSRTDKFLSVFESLTNDLYIMSITRSGFISEKSIGQTGFYPKAAWNSIDSRIGILYSDSGTLNFIEMSDNEPFSMIGAPITIASNPEAFDIAYDNVNNQYFISYYFYDSSLSTYRVCYTTYNYQQGFSAACPAPDYCSFLGAKKPKVAVNNNGDEYAIVWEDENDPKNCLAQTHEIHLKLLNNFLGSIHGNFDNILISDDMDLHAGLSPDVWWAESTHRWIVSWIEDTCQLTVDGHYYSALWQRYMNRNLPEGVVNLSSPSLLNGEMLLIAASASNELNGTFGGERSVFVWSDGKTDPLGTNYEIFANHAFSSHPLAIYPETNEIYLSNTLIASQNVKAASDGQLFLASYIDYSPPTKYLRFSLLDENLAIQNSKDKILVNTSESVKCQTLLYNDTNDEYWVSWLSENCFNYSSTVNQPIPDGDMNGVSDSIVVSQDEVIDYVSVKLNITHSEDNDLYVELLYTPPGGGTSTSVGLISYSGMGENFTNTVLYDDAEKSIYEGIAPYTGYFKPDNFLSAFSGTSTQGTWTLKVIDSNSNGEVGTFDDWEITFYTQNKDALYVRHINQSGSFKDAPTQLFQSTANYAKHISSALKPDGSMQGNVMFDQNSNNLQFYSFPTGTSSPTIVSTINCTDWAIAYNETSSNMGWGILWIDSAFGIHFAVVDDNGNFVVSPSIVTTNITGTKIDMVWDGIHYQVYYKDNLSINIILLNTDGSVFMGPNQYQSYGSDDFHAFFDGTETLTYWMTKTADEFLFSYRFFDNKSFPLTENLDITSKNFSSYSLNPNSIAMAMSNKKLFAAYGEGAGDNGVVFLARTLDINQEQLFCSTIKNRNPSAITSGPYSAAFGCSGTCITLDGSGSTTASPAPEEDLGDVITKFEWDLNGDANFGAECASSQTGTDFTGETVDLTQAELESMGISVPGDYTIWLRVTDEEGAKDCSSTIITITDGEPPTVSTITPNGGESWAYSPDISNRKQHLIFYEASDNFGLTRKRLSYTTDAGSTWTCIADTDDGAGGSICAANGLSLNSTSFLWSMPTQAEAAAAGQTFPSATCQIKAEVWDLSDNTTSDASDSNFYIIQPTTTSIKTVVLWNSARIENSYGVSAKNSLSLKLTELTDHNKINGVVLDLAGVPSVQSAYSTWDGAPTDQVKANAVSSAIRDYLYDTINGQLSTVYINARYIIIVGDDVQIPFYRMSDGTSIYSESNYPAEVGLNITTTVGSAINQDYFLTDNYYSESEPEINGSFTVYLNDYAIGRLVETPSQIEGVINTFLAADGQVNINDSGDEVLVTGFDFLYDSAFDIKEDYVTESKTTDCLLDDPDSSGSDPCIDKSYSPTDLENQLFNSPPIHQIANINTHANHYNWATSTGNLSTTVMDSNGNKLTGTALYTSGCHSGLPVPSADTNALDLPEEMAKKEVIGYIGNTGFGWGMRYGKGLTEKLMEKITENILGNDSIAFGQALARAKRTYYLEEKRYDVFDEKVIHELTYFGIPNILIVSSIAKSKPTNSALPAADGPDRGCSNGICMKKHLLRSQETKSLPSGVTELNLNFTFGGGTYQKVTTPDGDYYTLNGQSSGETGDAIQPHFVYNSYLSGTNAHGIVFLGGSYSNEASFQPVIAVPRSTNADSGEGSLPIKSTWAPCFNVSFGFDSSSTKSSAAKTIAKEAYTNMVVHTGSFDQSSSTLSLFDDMQFEMYYSNDEDKTSPLITDPGSGGFHTLAGQVATFNVEVTDASGIYRVMVTYNDSRTLTWKSFDLTYASGNTWTGTLTLKGDILYYVQAIDNNGNVGIVSQSGPDLDGNSTPYGSTWDGPKTFEINLTDTDSDGMPDAYEIQHSCLNKDVADASADTDHDYLTNAQEFSLDTDPCYGDTDGGGDNDGSEKNNNRRYLDKNDDKYLTIAVNKSGSDYTIDWNDSLGDNSVIDGYYFVYRSDDPFFSPSELQYGPLPTSTKSQVDSNPPCNPCFYKLWNYEIDTVPPVVNAIVPNSGTTAGGTNVIIYGEDIANGAKVYFDDVIAANIAFVNESQINCTTPAHSAGAVDIKIVNPNNQQGVMSGGYTYN